VNNAGITRPFWPDGKTMEDPSTAEIFGKYVKINLIAPFLVS